MSPTEAFAASWPFLVGVAELLAVLLATAHVVLRKDNVSSAIGWVGLIWLAPVVGPLLPPPPPQPATADRSHMIKAARATNETGGWTMSSIRVGVR